MSSLLTKEIIEMFKEIGCAFLTTASQSGRPHLSIVGYKDFDGQQRLRLMAWLCPYTLKNLHENPKVSVIIWDPKQDKGWQLVGIMEEMKDIAFLDGYAPEIEDSRRFPQIEREIIIRIEKTLIFQKAPHLDMEIEQNNNNNKKRSKNMNVKDIMTPNPACCGIDTNLKEVAKMMLDHDCGEIPVVDSKRRPMGVVTDRDIVCRIIAQGINPLQKRAGDCMSQPCYTVTPETSIEDCCEVFQKNKIRRVPVVDDHGSCCGIVSQADIATHNLKEELVEVMEMVSQPYQYAV